MPRRKQVGRSQSVLRASRLRIVFIGLIALITVVAATRLTGIFNTTDSQPHKVDLNQVVMTFAGMPIKAEELDAEKIARAKQLLQMKHFPRGMDADRRLADYMFFVVFDRIEIAKQLRQRQLPTQAALVNQVAPVRPFNAASSRQFYDEHPQLFVRSGPRIHVREIIVKDKDLANRIRSQLDQGASFEQLAHQYSADPSAYRDQGGDIGWVVEGQMPVEWDSVAFSLPVGRLSPVFRVANMYCVVQVVEDPQYDMVPYAYVSAKIPDIAAKYEQGRQFFTWLSGEILKEPIKIKVSSYDQPVTLALNDLRADLDQSAVQGT